MRSYSIDIWTGVGLFFIGLAFFLAGNYYIPATRWIRVPFEVIVAPIGFFIMCTATVWNLIVLVKVWSKNLIKDD
jgi:hypothetical protein